ARRAFLPNPPPLYVWWDRNSVAPSRGGACYIIPENSAIAGRASSSFSSRCPAGAARWSVGSPRFGAAADRKLTDRALHVKFDPGHLREQIDVCDPDRTSPEPHVGGHKVECLHQYADVLQNERIGDRAVLP